MNYDISQYSDIKLFLNTISYIYKPVSNGSWLTILCPFCDDSTRKSGKITHGHFYIARYYNYCHCFRCDYSNSFTRTLAKLGFPNVELLKFLSKNNTEKYTYVHNKLSINNPNISKENLLEYYENFKQKFPDRFNNFLSYLNYRCLNIDPIDFLIKPIIQNEYTLCSFYNYNGELSTSRFINHPKFRYIIPKNSKPYYYFQNIYNIDECKNIVITEGAIDLINIFNYCNLFNNKNTFYISIGGKQFNKILKELISNYLLIGYYHFNIILDNDGNVNRFRKLINSCENNIYNLNTNCKISFYYPPNSKDFSDLNLLDKL
jgi:hypothetical protein